MFDSPDKLLLGLVTGVVFGVLLQKGRVAKFPVIVGQFLLKDWTVAKIMGTAVVVGAVGRLRPGRRRPRAACTSSRSCSAACCSAASASASAWPSSGTAPAPRVAACGEGRRDAMAGVLGMFAGALAFVAAWPALQPVIKGLGDMGKVTLPDLTGTSPWLWVAGLAAAASPAAVLFRGRKPVRRSGPDREPRRPGRLVRLNPGAAT